MKKTFFDVDSLLYETDTQNAYEKKFSSYRIRKIL